MRANGQPDAIAQRKRAGSRVIVPMLDQIIERYMEWECSPREIIAAGFDAAAVRRAVTLLKRSEYKRRQAPIGVRVSRRAFGRDWRCPITARYADEYDEESGA